MIEFCREKAIEIRAHINYDKKMAANPGYLTSLLAPLTEEPPDVIYMVAYLNDAVALVKQLRTLNINSLLCGGAGGGGESRLHLPASRHSGGRVWDRLWTRHADPWRVQRFSSGAHPGHRANSAVYRRATRNRTRFRSYYTNLDHVRGLGRNGHSGQYG